MQLRSPDTSYNECVLIASEEREDAKSRYLMEEVETEEECDHFLTFLTLEDESTYCCSRKLLSN